MYFLDYDSVNTKPTIIRFYELYRTNADAEIPNSFWNNEHGLFRARVVTRYLIEEILKYERRVKVIRNLSTKDFKNNKLAGMLNTLFKGSIFMAVNNAYPNQYKECMFVGKRFYWDVELIKGEVELIACELGKDVRELRVRDINKADFVGGERVFQRMFGGFCNFITRYYPAEHWWISRGRGGGRAQWTIEQEKEAVTYVLVDKLGIDVGDTNTYHHVTVRDFYSEKMRFLCKKYSYSVHDLIHAHYPNLKISNARSGTYILVSPNDEHYIVQNIRFWVMDNMDKFPTAASQKTITGALIALTCPSSKSHSYRGWKAYRIGDSKSNTKVS